MEAANHSLQRPAGARAITVDTGLRLSRFSGMSEDFWIGLQMDYDAAKAKDSLAKTLAKIKPWTLGEARFIRHPDLTNVVL